MHVKEKNSVGRFPLRHNLCHYRGSHPRVTTLNKFCQQHSQPRSALRSCEWMPGQMLLTLLQRIGKTLSSVAVGLTDYVSQQIIREEEGEQCKWRQLTRLFTVRDSSLGSTLVRWTSLVHQVTTPQRRSAGLSNPTSGLTRRLRTRRLWFFVVTPTHAGSNAGVRIGIQFQIKGRMPGKRLVCEQDCM